MVPVTVAIGPATAACAETTHVVVQDAVVSVGAPVLVARFVPEKTVPYTNAGPVLVN